MSGYLVPSNRGVDPNPYVVQSELRRLQISAA